MIGAAAVPRPAAHTIWAWEGLALLAWLLPMTFAVLAHTDLAVISADELGMYRHTSDIVGYFRSDLPIAWNVQLGPRYFPDLPISLAAYPLGLGDPRAWGALFALANLGLVYGALRVLLGASGAAAPERRLMAIACMASLLLLIAISFQGGVNLLRTTRHNGLLGPALLFAALPLLGARVAGARALTLFVAGFGVLFGFVIHADPLFLVWSVVPTLAAALVVTLSRSLGRRGIAAALGVTLVALLAALALRRGFNALPFLAYQDQALTRPLHLGRLMERLPELGQDYAAYGLTSVVWLYGLALASGALSLLATWRAPAEVRRFRVYLLLLFIATVVVVPAAMVVRDMMSLRYLLWGIAVSTLPLGLGLADGLGRLRPQTAIGALAVILLVAGTPYFWVQARAAALRTRPESTLAAALDAEAAAGRIGRSGLASYWVAHMVPLFSDFAIAPLGKSADAFLVTENAFEFWDWSSGCPEPWHFTFVITAQKGPKRVQPAAIRAQFGRPAQIIPVAETSFTIWRYPNGVGAPEELYRDVVHRLERRRLSLRALDRCGPESTARRNRAGE